MAINLSLEFEEVFRIQDALQYQQHRSCNSKARELAHKDINSFEVEDEYVSEWSIESVEEL